MGEWREKTLGELTSYIAKGIPPKYVEEVGPETISVLNQKCNRNYRISYSEARLHDNSAKKAPADKLLRDFDVLINSTGTGTAGRVAQIWHVSKPTTLDGHMILMRPTEEIDPLYYGYAIKAFQTQVEGFAEGSTGQTEINKRRLQDEIVIRFPVSLDEQRAVGRMLKAIDEKIQNNEEVNDNLEQQAQALFRNQFLSQETLPDGWTKATLGEVSLMGAGGDKPKTVSATQTENCPYPIYSNGISDEGLYGFTDEYKIKDESITVSARGTIGFVCLRHIPYTPIVRLVTLIPNTDVLSAKYLYLWLKNSPIHGTGTTQQQLTVPDFRKTEIILPTKEEMASFTDTVTPLFETIWANQVENTKLSNMRDVLLPKLMSGELNVSDLDL